MSTWYRCTFTKISASPCPGAPGAYDRRQQLKGREPMPTQMWPDISASGNSIREQVRACPCR